MESSQLFYGGFFFIIMGIFMLVMAITNSNMLFGNSKTFNVNKIQGWVNLFGRNTTRVIVMFMGVFLIGFGIFWLWAF